MAKKETRRNESIRLAIVILLLAISQASAPPFFLGGSPWFGRAGESRQSKLVLEAGKHSWLRLAHEKPDSKHHDTSGGHDCLRGSSKTHCVTVGGLGGGGFSGSHDNGGEGTHAGSIHGSGGGFGDPGPGGFFVVGDLFNGPSGSGGSDGGSGGGGGSSGGGSSGGGFIGGSIGGGSGGVSGGGGGPGSDGPVGGGPGGGTNDGAGSGDPGAGDSGAVEGVHEDPVGGNPDWGCASDDPLACIPGDPDGHGPGCSLKNPEACAADDTGNKGDTDCPDPKLCGLPPSDSPVTTPVPEPSTLWLMGAGIAALVARRRSRRLNSAPNP